MYAERAWEQCHSSRNEDPKLFEGTLAGQVWEN